MEHTVSQGSQAWFDLRKQMIVTASNVADAVGGGRGKPYDFLLSLFQEENDSRCDNSNIQHGHEMEPVIREAYEMLTGNRTRSSGFWTIDKCDKMDDPLIGKLGASPDAIVLDDYGGMIGLCEFKAPVHVMYNDIPKQYLIQMHAQMAVTGAQWCDFMAVCIKTKSIMLKRIYFCEQFWSFISQRLLQFCSAYQEMSAGDGKGDDRATSKINTIKQWTVSSYGFPHQSQITIADLLTNNTSDKNIFIGPSEHRLTFDLLMGSYCPSPFPDYLYHREIEKVDQLIDKDMKYKIENKSKIELKDDYSKVESKDGTSKVNLNNTRSKVEMKDVYSTLKT